MVVFSIPPKKSSPAPLPVLLRSLDRPLSTPRMRIGPRLRWEPRRDLRPIRTHPRSAASPRPRCSSSHGKCWLAFMNFMHSASCTSTSSRTTWCGSNLTSIMGCPFLRRSAAEGEERGGKGRGLGLPGLISAGYFVGSGGATHRHDLTCISGCCINGAQQLYNIQTLLSFYSVYHPDV